MKQLIILSLSMALVFSTIAQSFVSPTIWLRADSVDVTDALWRDISGHGNDAVPKLHAMPPMSFGMNFNRCFEISDDNAFEIVLENLMTRKADALIVYETTDSVVENGLWAFRVDSASRIGLTTHRILNQRGRITYDTLNRNCAAINYLAQSWNSTDSCGHFLSVGEADSIPFSGRLSEYVFFNQHLDDTAVAQWFTYLAIKYGVTLYKSNYLDSKKQCVWNYSVQPDYSFSIAGIGRDSAMGLYQKQTFCCNRDIIFGLGSLADNNEDNHSVMADGDFVIIGMDSNGTRYHSTLYLSDGREFPATSRSLVQVTGSNTSQHSTFLRLDAVLFDNATPVIAIDRSGSGEYPLDQTELIYPDVTDSNGYVFFSNLHWDTDGNGTDAFCIIVDPIDTTVYGTRSLASKDNDFQSSNSYLLTPNPNAGRYTLEISLSECSDVTVNVCTADGKVVGTHQGKGRSQYVFEGSQRTPGLYLIDIKSTDEHKILKMIVQ